MHVLVLVHVSLLLNSLKAKKHIIHIFSASKIICPIEMVEISSHNTYNRGTANLTVKMTSHLLLKNLES